MNKTRSLPLLTMQKGMWISEQVHDAEVSHNVPIRVLIRGALDLDALQEAIDRLVDRHDNLRASFVLSGDAPQQVIAERIDAAVRRIAIEPGARGAESLDPCVQVELEAPIRIENGPLFRTVLFELGGDEFMLLFVIHHLVFDGRSIDILLRDFYAFFDAAVNGRDAAVELLPVSYAEHVSRQGAGASDSAGLAYWMKELLDSPGPQQFPFAIRNSDPRRRRAGNVVEALDDNTAGRLRALVGPGALTPFMVHVAVCAVLMHRHTAAEDIVFGVPLSTKNGAETAGLTGLFINVMPLRLRLSPRLSFAGLLQNVRARVLRAMMHGDVPFHDLVSRLRLGREAGSNPLFRICLNHAAVRRLPVQAGECRFELLPTANVTAAFDMNLALVENEAGFDIVFEFDDMLFERDAVAMLVGHYRSVLAAALSDWNTAVRDLELLTPDERQRAIVTLNGIGAGQPCDGPVHQLFEAQVDRSPDAIALVFEETRMSYRELNGRANQVAARLRRQGVGADVLVAICIDRSPEMVIGILAVLKAGGAYVPIDPDNPDERIRYILTDTAARTLLTSTCLRARFADCGAELVCLDDPAAHAAFGQNDAASLAGMHNLAYCIYTSGSTGQPKGALNTHQGIANLVQWYVRGGLTMSAGERVMLASSFGFDLTQKNILGPLCAGACLMMPACSPADAGGFLKALRVYQPTWLNCAPSAFRAFAASGRARSITTLVLGGEPIDAALVAELADRPVTLVNSYGPTECSDVAIWCSRSMQAPHRSADFPLGQPVPGVQIYLLDERLQPVPNGVPGEIHIAGTGVGRGYLHRPALTAEKFIPNPYGSAGSRMYKTGDLGRRLVDGTIEFIGRLDFQVKVRGHRIELGEIESRLLDCERVHEAVVVAQEVAPGDKRLVGYVVASGEVAPSADELRHSLRYGLPEYMVPTAWVFLARLPLNINGKVDRKALPLPDWKCPSRCESFVAPRTLTEQRLAGIWADVLKIDQVGVSDNFFALWGHSLLATQMIARIAEQFGIEVPTRTVFNAENLGALAQQIDLLLEVGKSAPTALLSPMKRQKRVPVE